MKNMEVDGYMGRSRGLEIRDARKGMIAHAIIITAVCALLAVINATLTSKLPGRIFPAAGTAFGVAVQYVLGVRLLDLTMEQ